MKCVILAAGEGKRLRPLTSTKPKSIIPIANKPILQHIIENLRCVNIKDIIIVIGYHSEKIENYFGSGEKYKVNIEYVKQYEQLGTGNALLYTKDFVNEQFILLHGDIIFHKNILKDLVKAKKPTMIVKHVENCKDFGMVIIKNRKVIDIIEKAVTQNGYINTGIYLLNKKIFDVLEKTEISERGEYELTTALKKSTLYCQSTKDYWYDIGKHYELLNVNEILMQNLKQKIYGKINKNVTLKGSVEIKKDTQILVGTYIVGPVSIGENCVIGPNAYIRACTTIGDNVHIGNACEIKNSIIMANTKIPHFNYVGDSIIGENCNFGAGSKIANLRFDKKEIYTYIDGKPMYTGRKKFGAVIGDNVQIGINAAINIGSVIGENSYIGYNSVVFGNVAPNSKIW